jgi:hypothetical protein
MPYISYIEKLEKEIGDTAELIALKQKHAQDLAEVEPKYQQIKHEQEQCHKETIDAALDYERRESDRLKQETCVALGLTYFSIHYSSAEERDLHHELHKKDIEFRAPILKLMVQSPLYEAVIPRGYKNNPWLFLQTRLLNERLPLISIDQTFQRIKEETLGFIWIEKVNVIDFLKDTNNEAIQLFLHNIDFRTNCSYEFFRAIETLDGFKQHAYMAMKKYNQKILEITGLEKLSIGSWPIDSAHVSRGLVPRQDVNHTRAQAALYAKKQREADLIYKSAVDPLAKVVFDINRNYEDALKALAPKTIPHYTPLFYFDSEKPMACTFPSPLNNHKATLSEDVREKKSLTIAFDQKIDEECVPIDFDVLQYCVDYDGCTDTPEAQAALVEHIVQRALKNTKCTHIQLAIASRRQSLHSDFFNALNYYLQNQRKLLSAATMLATIERLLKVKITEAYQKIRPDASPPAIELNPLLTFDIFNQLKPGTSYRFMSQEDRYASFHASTEPVALWVNNEIDEPVCLFRWMKPEPLKSPSERSIICDDPSKTLTHYMFAHHGAIRFPGKKIAHVFVDNLRTLLEHGAAMVESNSEAFPTSCYFQGIQLDVLTRTMGHFKTAIIQGRGKVNPLWQEGLREIASQNPNTLENASTDRLFAQLTSKPKDEHSLMLDRLLSAANFGAISTASSVAQPSNITTANLPSITFFAPWLSKPVDPRLVFDESDTFNYRK